jgi:hypothetical protein
MDRCRQGQSSTKGVPVGVFQLDSKLNFKGYIMKRQLLFGILIAVTSSLIAAESNPKEEISDAAKKLAAAGNYSWKTTIEFGNFTGTTDGKTEKEGVTFLSMTFGDNTTEAFLKGTKGAVKTPDQEWQSLAELETAAGTEPGPRQFLVRRLQNFKAPSAELSDLAGKIKELKKEGEAYSGDLTEAGAKELLSFGRRAADAAGPKNAKGSVKIWLKSGAPSKFEVKVQGSVNFNGEDRDVDRTTTTEIKDVGATKIQVPEAATKKLT